MMGPSSDARSARRSYALINIFERRPTSHFPRHERSLRRVPVWLTLREHKPVPPQAAYGWAVR
jgi:hypothetical protein